MIFTSVMSVRIFSPKFCHKDVSLLFFFFFFFYFFEGGGGAGMITIISYYVIDRMSVHLCYVPNYIGFRVSG